MEKTVFEKAVQLRHALHAHPELSGQEIWTKAQLICFLKENTKLAVVDKGKWFYAVYRGGGERPSIGFRTEMDALPIEDNINAPYASTIPGCGHKCGHDGHAATMCAFAMELERLRPERNVYMVFQHAEETGAGGRECQGFVAETGVEELYAFHNSAGLPAGTLMLYHGCYGCASMGISIAMTGISTHASTPEKGKNPARALCTLACEIEKIADPKRFESFVLATIVEVNIGEHAFGVAASRGNVGVTLRALAEKDMYQMRDEIVALSEKLAKDGGFSLQVSYEDVFPETVCTERASRKIAAAAEACGYPICWAEQPNRGSEDFGWFLKHCEGAIFELSCAEEWPEFHSDRFDFDDKLIPLAVQVFLQLTDM